MTNFFRGRNRHATTSTEGLVDTTNLSTSKSSTVQLSTVSFSTRRLRCFAGGGSDMKETAKSSLSPPKDVASTWMQMGNTGNTKQTSVSSSLRASRGRDSHQEEAGISSTTQNHASTRVQYCGSRRIHQETRSGGPEQYQRTHANQRHQSRPKPWRPNMPAAASASSRAASRSLWKAAVDPKSGRTYYYNVRTRETQWRKPMELATDSERKEMEAKERKQKDFFAAMEANILKSMAQGQVPAGTPSTEEKKVKAPSATATLEKPRMVRTISGMNDQILRDIVKRVPSLRMSKSAMPREDSLGIDDLNRIHDEGHLSDLSQASQMSFGNLETSLADLNFDMDGDSPSAVEENRALEQLAETAKAMTLASGSAKVTSSLAHPQERSASPNQGQAKPLQKPSLEKPDMTRRNTCGTMYVGSTMSAPDKDATIKCVCGVYRAHILSAADDEGSSRLKLGGDDKYRIFNDQEADRLRAGTVQEDKVLESFSAHVPSLEEITSFYRDVFRRAQMESDCIIMSLIYVERLIKKTDGGLRPRPSNWRSLLFSCMILSSKVWDDLSMWNADFSQTCPAGVRFSLQRINELELAILAALNYTVKVPASEYAKYYFLLRSMLIKSGLGGDDIQTMTPLDVEGAKKLEQVSSSFQSTVATKQRVAQVDKMRSKSMGHVDANQGAESPDAKKASLEHMVKM